MLISARQCVWLGISCLLLTTVCHSQANRCFPDETPEFPSSSFSRGVENFGLDIFQLLVRQQSSSSIFVSPYSLWSVLTLAYFGAEGRTRRQLERALNLKTKSGTFNNWKALKFVLNSNPRSQSGATFRSANRAYFARDIHLNNCLNNILFDLRQVDFTRTEVTRNLINQDISTTTEGKIENFISFLAPQTRFVLINAVFFKGLWQLPFNATNTRIQEFVIPPGSSAGNVEMMIQTGTFRHGHAPSLGATLLELPYENSSTSMFLMLPDTWDTDIVVQRLNRTTFVEGASLMTRKRVEVGLPRFKMTTTLEEELKSVLSAMGIVDLFEARAANLTAFTHSENLSADTAIHRATIEVTEEGTVAAAASGILNTRFGGNISKFICNRPFLFLITDKITGITLFAGKYAHPDHTERP